MPIIRHLSVGTFHMKHMETTLHPLPPLLTCTPNYPTILYQPLAPTHYHPTPTTPNPNYYPYHSYPPHPWIHLHLYICFHIVTVTGYEKLNNDDYWRYVYVLRTHGLIFRTYNRRKQFIVIETDCCCRTIDLNLYLANVSDATGKQTSKAFNTGFYDTV